MRRYKSRRAIVRLAATSLVATTVVALAASSTLAPASGSGLSARPPQSEPPHGANPVGTGDPYLEQNGFLTYYVRDPEGFDGFEYPPTTYDSITADLEAGWHTDRGIHHIGIYGAWKSSHHWLGLPPLDYFDAQVGTGTIEDFEEMADTAAERGINVYMYMQLIYIHPDNPVFQKAAADKAAGVDSYATRLFRWDERPQPQATCPAGDGLPEWASWTRDPSVADNRCYVQSWGEAVDELPLGFPAFDYTRPAAMKYAKKVLAFWMDLGVEGFIYDAPHTYLGMQGRNEWRQTALQVTYVAKRLHPGDPTPYGLYLDAEGNIGRYQEQERSDRIGFTAVHVGAEDDFNTFVTMAARDPQLFTADQLEDHFATWVDTRRQVGRWSLAHSPFDFDPTTMPGELRALDAAVQAGGAGVAVFNHRPTLDAHLDEEAEAAYYDVFRAIEKSPALAPGASRQRVPTQDDPRAYAVLRRSMDGRHAAVAVFNLSAEPRCVTVNLARTGVRVPQQTTDIATGAPGPWLGTRVMSIALPAYGYRFLDVEAGPGFPWRVIDSAGPAVEAGAGWRQVADPSAFGASRIAGDRAGGFAKLTFRGRSVEGWGRMAVDGATRVVVSVDGRRIGVHSQRRESPAPQFGGEVFYGQRLFSVTGLHPGRHTVVVRQQATAPGQGGQAGVDYFRVSERRYVAPGAPPVRTCG